MWTGKNSQFHSQQLRKFDGYLDQYFCILSFFLYKSCFIAKQRVPDVACELYVSRVNVFSYVYASVKRFKSCSMP